jgi:hypothetical protein
MHEVGRMKYKVKRVHFVGIGGADASRKQGPVAPGAMGCDRPRAAPAAGCIERNGLGDAQ